MKTRRYSVLFEVLSYATIVLFVLMAAAGVAAYTIHSTSNTVVEGNSAKIDNAGPGSDAATFRESGPDPGDVRPRATPPVGILATPPRELQAANRSVNTSPAASAPSRPSIAPSAPPSSSPAATLTGASESSESRRTVARPPQPVASGPSAVASTQAEIHGQWDVRGASPYIAEPAEVRRAIPVTHPSVSNRPADVRRASRVIDPSAADATTRSRVAGAPSQFPPPPGVSERQIVETLPDGRTRITVFRTVRTRDADE